MNVSNGSSIPAVGLRSPRVVQWATGNIGTRSLRAVIEHPHLTLAGLHVRAADKAGRDAGDLCGLSATGVTATREIGDIVGLDADCVLYMPLVCDVDEVCQLLASGANIVTTCGEFHHPASMDPVVRERVEAACQAGGTSIYSTGVSPGFITESIPMVLASLQRRLDNLVIHEFADLSQRDSPALLFDVMGFGQPPTEFDERRLSHVRSNFGSSLGLLAEALSLPLDAVEASGRVAVARHSATIAAGTLQAGTVAAQEITISGLRGGRPLLQFRATWYCIEDLEPALEIRKTGWHLWVDGDTPLDIDMRIAVPIERMGAMSPAFTANRAVNAVPYVCSAAPGIRTTLDLPQITAALA
jgi:4-hydroxy-tetrahydrodipicolinate reductase